MLLTPEIPVQILESTRFYHLESNTYFISLKHVMVLHQFKPLNLAYGSIRKKKKKQEKKPQQQQNKPKMTYGIIIPLKTTHICDFYLILSTRPVVMYYLQWKRSSIRLSLVQTGIGITLRKV